MDLSTGKTSSTGRIEPELATPTRILLVGPDGLSLAPAIDKLIGDDAAVEQTESFLEAVLMSGAGGVAEGMPLILAGISQEIDQLEKAVRSLRTVNPNSRIVLLCEPGDEVLCRKARAWGATDYIILPVDAASLRRVILGAPAAAPKPPAAREERRVQPITPAQVMRTVVGVTGHGSLERALLGEAPPAARPAEKPDAAAFLPTLPLMVQTALFADLVTGRSDFAERVVATLQAYMKWGGTLNYISVAEGAIVAAPTPQQLRTAVEFSGHGSFGTLTLDITPPNVPNSTTAAALSQAGQWLAALLAVARRQEQLRSLAITDELSGAYNRRYFEKFMSGLLERARENRFRVTLLMFDIDDFKKYNDTFGHSAGDAIIRELIKLLRACTRPHDLVARIGGDEFAVVYWDNEAPRQPNSEHPRDAIVATERFRKAVQTHEWSAACNIKGDLSISGGLATFPWDADSLEMLMARADEALLKAKSAGKNVIFLHGAACTESEPPTPEDPPAAGA